MTEQASASSANTASGRLGGWGLMREAVARRKVGIAIGVGTGLAWTSAKVSTGVIVRNAVDRGIEADDTAALIRWSSLLGVVAVCSAVFTGLRRYFAFRGPLDRARPARPPLRPRPAAALRLPRPGADRAAHEPG